MSSHKLSFGLILEKATIVLPTNANCGLRG